MRIKQKSYVVLLAVLLAAVITAFAVSLSGVRVHADSAALFSGQDVTVSEDCAPYDYLPVAGGDYGCKLSFAAAGATAEYSELIELDGETELLSLSMLPSRNGLEQALAQTTSFTVRVEQEDDSGKYFEVNVNGTVDVFQTSGFSALSAAAPGQSLGGEAAYNAAVPAKGGHDGSDYIRDFGANVKNFSFTGRNANILKLYYNNDTQTLSGTPVMGNYRATIRRFSHAYTDSIEDAKALGVNTAQFFNDPVTFEGFDSGKKVKLSITVSDLRNRESAVEMLVYSVGGKKALSGISAELPSLAMEGGKYTLPVPVSYLSGRPAPMSGNYSVLAPDGETVVSEGIVADGVEFDTVSAGDYKIVYDDGSDTASYTLKCVPAADMPDYPFVFTDVLEDYEGFIACPGYRLPLKASAVSGLDLIGGNVKLSALIYGASGELLDTVGFSNEGFVTLGAEGDYEIVYRAVDYVGRSIESAPVPLTVSYSQVAFAGEVNAFDAAAYGSDSALFNPGRDDVVIFDSRYVGMDGGEVTVSISVAEPGSDDFTAFSDEYRFDKLGEYTIRYDYSYKDVAGSVRRTLNVYDSTPPALVYSSLPVNTAVNPAYASSASNVYLKARTGVSITLPYVAAVDRAGVVGSLMQELKFYEIAPDGVSVDKSADYKADAYGYDFTPDKTGVYIFRFTVKDSAGLDASLNFIVDVRDVWLTVTPGAAFPGSVKASENFVIPNGLAADFFGQVSSGAAITVKLFYGDELIDSAAAGKSMRACPPGVYRAEYSASANGETSDVFNATFTVTDDLPPSVAYTDAVEKASAGKSVALAEFTVADNDLIAHTSVKVWFGDTEIDIFNGFFTPEKSGEYRVEFTATDVAGNVFETGYTVTVSSGLPVWAIVLIAAGGAAVVAGAAAAAVILLKKRAAGTAGEGIASESGAGETDDDK